MTFYLWTFIPTSFYPQKETVVLALDNYGNEIDLISFNLNPNLFIIRMVVSIEKLCTWYE